MTAGSFQNLQEFFDSPAAMAADYNLSASAAEPMLQSELLSFEADATERLNEVLLTYPARHGPEAMRNLLAKKYPGIGPEGIVLTSGLDEALGMLFLALVKAGDRVVVLNPCYPPHMQIPEWRRANVVSWSAKAEQNWVPDLDELRQLLKVPTKAVIVTLPQNPTGFAPDAAYKDELISIVSKSGAYLVSDEIYAGLSAAGTADNPNLACRYEKAITLHGLSKIYGLPGLRVGWMATRDKAFLKEVRSIKNLFNAYFPAPIEFLAQLALRHEKKLIARCNEILGASTALAADFFAQRQNLFEWTAPDQGCITFPRWLGPGGAKGLSDGLLEHANLVFAPSTCFQMGDEHLRLCLARRNIDKGLERLDRYLEKI